MLGAAVLLAIVLAVGAGPFVDGVTGLDPGTVAASVLLGAIAIGCCALRWCVVARRLGLELRWSDAVAACWSAQLLNSVLPGGVVGDVDRGLVHGREVASRNTALRAVGWERCLGQVTLVVVALPVVLGGPLGALVRPAFPAAAVVVTAVVVVAATVGGGRVASDLRLLAAPGPAVLAVATSLGAVTCWAATFVLAAHAVGVSAPPGTLLAVTLLVLVGAAVPVNLAGWGPREGVAAAGFTAAGLGPSAGVATATAYGVLALAAALPGLVVLVRRGRRSGAARVQTHAAREPEVLHG